MAKAERLRKELGLFDVYAISTGAMFSSGFFLLPGLAAAQTGPSVPLAYLVAGILIIPAMLAVAELATAMPRAGGAYYFLDRALGPLAGTVGGLGTWLALILKSAFALVGMGAYLAIYFDVPIKPLAVGFTALFTVINIVGAKETSGLQRWLVGALLVILSFFIVQGVLEVLSVGLVATTTERFTPLLPFGLTGFASTVGFVFVSYAGLTKVASVSEEIENPDRNIPLGMMLSLLTATFVYTVGVFILVAVLPAAELRDDLTPVATAAAAFFDWLPGELGVMLIVVAAIAAFASTGNAGILSASRYPLAMARDRLIPASFETLGRFRTPTLSILVTSGLMVAAILFLDLASIAKLASAFQLFLFSVLTVSVVIMRESRIGGYDPGFRSPLYPWMQLFGFLAPLWLIAEMGQTTQMLTLLFVAAAMVWFFAYGRSRVQRSGAIFHTFERLASYKYDPLELELDGIARERGLRAEDPFDEIVMRASTIDLEGPVPFEDLATFAAASLAASIGADPDLLAEGFTQERAAGFVPVARGVALPHVRLETITTPSMVLARCRQGVSGTETVNGEAASNLTGIRAVVFLVSPEASPGQHLRLLGHLATRVDDPGFLAAWDGARNEAELKASVLHDERSAHLKVGEGPLAGGWTGLAISEIDLPEGSLVALVQRGGEVLVPGGSTRLMAGDRLTVIGTAGAIAELRKG